MKKIITFIGVALLLVSVSAGVSDVRTSLNDIASKVSSVRFSANEMKKIISSGISELNSIQAKHSKVISEINGYTSNGEFKKLVKDELKILLDERDTLLSALQEAERRLSTISFE